MVDSSKSVISSKWGARSPQDITAVTVTFLTAGELRWDIAISQVFQILRENNFNNYRSGWFLLGKFID